MTGRHRRDIVVDGKRGQYVDRNSHESVSSQVMRQRPGRRRGESSTLAAAAARVALGVGAAGLAHYGAVTAAARVESIASEYRALGIDPALAAILDERDRTPGRELNELIVVTDSPAATRRRFTVRRLPIQWVRLEDKLERVGQRAPWVIKDRERPSWLGHAPTQGATIKAIDIMLEGETRGGGADGVTS